VHLACAWAFSLATVASAYFILAANSWMQHPVGVKLVAGKPQLTSIWALLTNNTALAAIPHTVAGCFAVSGSFLVGVAVWHLTRRTSDRAVWRASLKVGGWVSMISFAAVAITGDFQGKLMFEQQPMKMAAAEALCHTEAPASFSILAYGDVQRPDCEDVKSITVPALLSFLAHNDFSSEVKGIDELVGEYQAKYGTNYPVDPQLGELSGQPIDYVPNLPVTYWGFRLMIGLGALAAAAAALALWLTRKGRMPASPWFRRAALLGIALPFLANSAGWIFTEMGRQPFVVVPNPTGVDGVWMFTARGVSGLAVGEILTSLIVLTALYGGLAVLEFFLLRRYARAGIEGVLPAAGKPAEQDELAFAY
jgi:cytochrome d ubiquinol oxidase subunit I